MDVYLVPVGTQRYELYCEIPDEPEDQPDEPAKAGFIRRLVQRFREMLAEAEHERRHGRPDGEERGWAARTRGRMMRWVAESIAEQRLLWHLRRQSHACMYYPDDLDEASAVTIRRQQLRRDFEKHRFWLVVDSLIFIASGLLALVPGPNVLAYYFGFRLVGHYLSLRGAQRGSSDVAWREEKSAPLTELRRVLSMDPQLRESRVHAVAERLRLEHLASFFQRTAVSA